MVATSSYARRRRRPISANAEKVTLPAQIRLVPSPGDYARTRRRTGSTHSDDEMYSPARYLVDDAILPGGNIALQFFKCQETKLTANSNPVESQRLAMMKYERSGSVDSCLASEL